MKAQHDKHLERIDLKEGDLVLWFLGKVDKIKKGLTITWSGPYELFGFYKNGLAKLRDLQGLELPNKVN